MGFITARCCVNPSVLDSRCWQNFYLRMMEADSLSALVALILELVLSFKGTEERGDHLEHLPISFILHIVNAQSIETFSPQCC